MNIGIDIDDVLVDTSTYMLRHLNEIFGTGYKREQILAWHIEELFLEHGTREELFLKIRDYARTRGEEILPLAGAVEAVKVLSKDNLLIAITAREEDLKEMTIRSLEKNFKGNIKEVYFAGLSGKKRRKKSDIIREKNIDLYIDDRWEYVLDCALTGCKVLLFDHPWNRRGELPSNVTRVHNWQEIIREIEKLTK